MSVSRLSLKVQASKVGLGLRSDAWSRLVATFTVTLLFGLTGCASSVAPTAPTPSAKAGVAPAATPTDMPAPSAAPVSSAPGSILYANDSGLWTLQPSTLAVRQVSAAAPKTVLASPAVSPDGRQVAYSFYDAARAREKRDNGTDLYLMPVEGGAGRLLLAHEAVGVWLGEPAWRPDGKSLLFTYRDALGKESIQRVGIDGESRQVVVQDAASPTLSRDGRRLAYLTTDAQSYGQTLWLADADGSKARSLVGTPQFESLATPRLSPDGARIAFIAIGGPDQQPPRAAATPPSDPLAWLRPPPAAAHGILYNVWTVNADGNDLRRLTLDLEVEVAVLAWSPDGRWLVFESDHGLNLVSADGKEVHYLAKQYAVGGIDWYRSMP